MSDSGDSNKIIEFLKKLTENESVKDLKKFGIGFFSLVITCAVMYFATYDPEATTNKFYLYAIFGILPIMIGIVIASKIFKGPIDITRLYFYGGILFMLIIGMYMFYRILNPSSVLYVTYALQFLLVIIFILGLAILYRIFVRTIVGSRGISGFLLKLLFLIPCLLVDFFETISAELKVAPNMIIFLFVLEVLVILMYIYMPRVSTPPSDAIVLLNKPVFLSNVQSIGKTSQLFMSKSDIDNPEKSEEMIRENYSISMWVYVNPHPNTYAAYSKETNIFRYGPPSSKVGGHPRVAYFNDRNDTNKTDKFIVYVNDVNSKDASGVLLQIPMQSWNQLVISYNKSVVDIFVNGSLEKTVPVTTEARPLYDSGDIIEVGEGDNTVTKGGLHGAICNVVYHKSPMTEFQVAGEYNLNRYKNPPIN